MPLEKQYGGANSLSKALGSGRKVFFASTSKNQLDQPPNMKIIVIVWSMAIFFATPV
jgi:hypothetical protein